MNVTPTQAANIAAEPFRQVTRKTRIAIIALWGITLSLTAIMWLINIKGASGANFAFVILSLPLILLIVVSPKLVLAALGASIIDDDAGKIILKAVLVLAYTFGFLATVLATWSFQEAPGAFWGLFAITQMLLLWQVVYGGNSGLSQKLQLGYLIVSAALILLSTTGITNKVNEWYTEAEEKMASEAALPESTTPTIETKVAGPVMTDVPAEGLLVTIAPGTKVIRFTVPKDTIAFRNYIPTASVDEINRGSWMDYLVQGPRTGERESLIVKPGLTETITVMVDPFTLEENTAALPANN